MELQGDALARHSRCLDLFLLAVLLGSATAQLKVEMSEASPFRLRKLGHGDRKASQPSSVRQPTASVGRSGSGQPGLSLPVSPSPTRAAAGQTQGIGGRLLDLRAEKS